MTNQGISAVLKVHSTQDWKIKSDRGILVEQIYANGALIALTHLTIFPNLLSSFVGQYFPSALTHCMHATLKCDFREFLFRGCTHHGKRIGTRKHAYFSRSNFHTLHMKTKISH